MWVSEKIYKFSKTTFIAQPKVSHFVQSFAFAVGH